MSQARCWSAVAAVPLRVAAILSVAGFAGAACAFTVDTGNPDVEARWDTQLRYNLGTRVEGRLAMADVEMGGQTIHAGERVMFMNGATNRDPAVFPEPDRFDITRSPNRHLTFGYGVHACLGAMLARLETRIAITAILERMPDLKLEEGTVLEPLASSMVFGVDKLPVRFTPGKRYAA